MMRCKIHLPGLYLLLSCAAPSSSVPGEDTSESEDSSAQDEGEEGAADSLDEESTDAAESEADSSDAGGDSTDDEGGETDGNLGDCDISLVGVPPADLVSSEPRLEPPMRRRPPVPHRRRLAARPVMLRLSWPPTALRRPAVLRLAGLRLAVLRPAAVRPAAVRLNQPQQSPGLPEEFQNRVV